jgi:hypothetical protein
LTRGIQEKYLASSRLAGGTLLFTLGNRPTYPALALRGGSAVAMGLASLWLVERIANVSLLSFS